MVVRHCGLSRFLHYREAEDGVYVVERAVLQACRTPAATISVGSPVLAVYELRERPRKHEFAGS